MANYLVRARPRLERMAELQAKLESGEFAGLQPYGSEMQRSLAGARLDDQGVAAWETMCYCPKPLMAEREKVLDTYFDEWEIKMVASRGAGWAQLAALPKLWDAVAPFEIPKPREEPAVHRPRRPGLRR